MQASILHSTGSGHDPTTGVCEHFPFGHTGSINAGDFSKLRTFQERVHNRVRLFTGRREAQSGK
jgi:hypothetical protein